MRITAQLIDAQKDNHLWSQTFDRPLTTDNIFAIQDEISNAIVKALSKELEIGEIGSISINKITNNLSAYELFLEAKALYLQRFGLDKVDQLLAQAIQQDPKFYNA